MRRAFWAAAAVAVLAVLAFASGAAYTVRETEQVIITQFGKPVGDPVVTAGLKFKLPFIQKANRLERRVLAWDGRPVEMPTRDKTYIIVDTFGRWRIDDPKLYLVSLREERRAQSRIEDILGSETRSAVANHDLIEVVRTSKDREPVRDEQLVDEDMEVVWKPITKGRVKIEEEVFANAAPKLKSFGIELLDVRFKRINYRPEVRNKIYSRMISERQRIAERFRSEGAGEAARILGNKERELKRIESEAYRKVEEIRGAADAEATGIYAAAYNQSPEAAAFYEFTETLKLYRSTLSEDTSVILSTDSDLFRFLKEAGGSEGGG